MKTKCEQVSKFGCFIVTTVSADIVWKGFPVRFGDLSPIVKDLDMIEEEKHWRLHC